MWVWQHGKVSLFVPRGLGLSVSDRAIAGYLSITEADAALASGELSAISLTEAVFDRVEQFDSVLNAYVRLMVDSATAEAVASDVRARRGDRLQPTELRDLASTGPLRMLMWLGNFERPARWSSEKPIRTNSLVEQRPITLIMGLLVIHGT